MTDSDDASPEAGESAMRVVCPHCGLELEVGPAEGERAVECPACGGEFVVPGPDGVPEYESAERPEPELDALRVRQIVMARRAAIRGRTYMLLGAMLCAVGLAKLVTMIVPAVRQEGWSRYAIGCGIFAVLAAMGAIYCLRRAAELNKESKSTPLPESATPPDFTTLSDGSQHVRNLEALNPDEGK
jgi:hypothetical protein